MVLFKFEDKNNIQNYPDLFTFHYGSIQMISQEITSINIKIYIPLWFYSNCKSGIYVVNTQTFTFHYGSIQIATNLRMKKSKLNLHSTMVLFKLR